MLVRNRNLIVLALMVCAFLGAVESRAVNISNTWMLPEEGFPVFYRYFRDRISWYEADAVCQFHHANLVTADSTSQYDAIRAYLKELDITEKVWIGLSKAPEKSNFIWTDFRPLSGEGHWQESMPAGDSQSLCAVMDPAADFLWRPLPCGGPEVAAFICELTIPSWALGPRGCLLTELPSLTVLYVPEQSALELTSDCGLDGTKRIACKGNADHEKMLKELTCVIPEDVQDNSGSDEKTTKTSTGASDYETSSTFEDDFVVTSDPDKTAKSWTSNTINPDVGTPTTRHRRETEDTLSPVVSTKSSFKQTPETDLSWHQDKQTVLTTPAAPPVEHQTTPAVTPDSTATLTTTTTTAAKKPENKTVTTSKPTLATSQTTPIATTLKPPTPTPSNKGKNASTATQAAVEDYYPSAINQGQLFSIIENGTMFDIIELNETEQEPNKPTKKPVSTKKPLQPTKKFPIKSTPKPIQNVDELEENLTKEFEMMPEIQDTSLTLNRTFRKQPPAPKEEHDALESGSQFGVPRIINFTVSNYLEPEDEGYQADQAESNNTDVVISRDGSEVDQVGSTPSNQTKLDHDDDAVTLPSAASKPASTTEDQTKNYLKVEATVQPLHPIDPRLYILNSHPHVATNNQSEPVHKSAVSKEEFLPKTLIGQTQTGSTAVQDDNYTEHPFPSDEPKKMNRHRSLHNSGKPRKFYPYFFSRMLG